MRHAASRQIIARLLLGQGFGQQAVAQDLMAALVERGACPDSLAAQLDALTKELGTDSARPYQGPINQAPIPADGRALCAQLLPAILDQPADIGLSLACLATLVELWPFVSSQERPLVRVRFMNGLLSRRAEDGSQVCRQQLRSWQRELPTEMSVAAPTVAGLQRLLLEPNAEGAYRCLAEHLDPRFDLRTLAHVLGTLAVAVLRQFHDRDGNVLHVLVGATGLERMCTLVDPELMATALAQLGHQLWWCRQRAHLPVIRTCIDPSQPRLRAAVISGDVTLAQRAARALSNTPAAFWTEVWALLEESLARKDEEWPRALAMVGTILYRSGTQAISPDDAAALAAVVTDMAHQRERILLS